MGWKVEFYNTKVEKNIEQWPVHLRIKFLKIVDLREMQTAVKRMKEVKGDE